MGTHRGINMLQSDLDKARQRCEKEIREVNNLIPGVNSSLATIKTHAGLIKKHRKKYVTFERKIDKECNSGKFSKEERDLLQKFNHTILVLIQEEELEAFLKGKLQKAEELKKTFLETRNRAIREAVQILEGNTSIQREKHSTEELLPPAHTPLVQKQDQFHEEFLRRWVEQKNALDYTLYKMLFGIWMKGNGYEKDQNALNLQFQKNEKMKRRAVKGYGLVYESRCIYGELLILERQVFNKIQAMYQEIYREMIRVRESSPRSIRGNLK